MSVALSFIANLLLLLLLLLPSTLRSKEYEEHILALSEELAEVKGRLHTAEKQSTKPSPMLLQLQEDLKRVKVCEIISCSPVN